MSSINVVMSFKSILVSSLLIAILPATILILSELLLTKSVSSTGLWVSIVLFFFL
ncbi:hypothetical protein D9M69_493250 [compost metagenome]